MNDIATETQVPPWAAGTEERMHELDPVLSDAELDILLGYGEQISFSVGDYLWHAGERTDFFAILTGELDVMHAGENGDETFITHSRGHYGGEIVTLSGGRALVSGKAATDGSAIRLTADEIRRVIATETDLGEKILLSFILRRMRMVAENFGNVRLVGRTESLQTGELENFLSRSGVPYEVVHPDQQSELTAEILGKHGLDREALPVLICSQQTLVKPTHRQVAEALGFTAEFDCGVTYDLAIIGSGPAGLASAVYAASEGLSVLVLENCAVGGQAGSSSKIENYMGFPTGISGQALTGRGYIQAQKFGASIAIARQLLGFEQGADVHKLRVDGDDVVYARAVVLATGAIYRQPEVDRLGDIGGVHYGASHVEGELCRGRDVAIVGGGNSAGQAAVYLSKRARNVHILVRGPGLAASMSDYLIQRIDNIENVHLHTFSEIDTVNGTDTIESIVVRNNRDDSTTQMDVSNVFVFIGVRPGTGFVDGQIALDKRGFILTGDDLDADTLRERHWPLERRPYLLETSCPRIFAAGDVRSGSVKRVASAVGEGSVCIQFVHAVLSSDSN